MEKLVQHNLLYYVHSTILLELEPFKVVQSYSQIAYFVTSTLHWCRGLTIIQCTIHVGQFIGFKANIWADSIQSSRYE